MNWVNPNWRAHKHRIYGSNLGENAVDVGVEAKQPPETKTLQGVYK